MDKLDGLGWGRQAPRSPAIDPYLYREPRPVPSRPVVSRLFRARSEDRSGGRRASVNVPPDCPAPPNISASTGKCGPFPYPLEPLDTGFNTLIGPPIGVEAFGCGPGQVPADGTPFSVEAGWSATLAYSCNGTFGSEGRAEVIQLTAHNMVTGTDLPAETFAGIAGSGGYLDLPLSNPAPAGRFVIRVTLPHPTDNQCQWHLIVHRAP